MGIFGAAHWQKGPFPKICHPYPTIMKLGTVIPYLKKYMNHVTHTLTSADISICFNGNQQILLYQQIQIQLHFST